MTIIAIGTLAPAPLTVRLPGGLQPWLLEAGDATHVSLLQADPDRWESFDEVLRVNPVAAVNPHCVMRWKGNTRRLLNPIGRRELSGTTV